MCYVPCPTCLCGQVPSWQIAGLVGRNNDHIAVPTLALERHQSYTGKTYLVVGRGEASAPQCFRSLMSKRNWSFTKPDSCAESCVSGCSCVCPHMCACVYTCTHTCIHVEVLPWVLSIWCFEAEALVLEPAMQAGLCGQQAPGIHLSKLPQSGIKKINHYFWLFCVGPVEQPHISWKPCTCQWVSSLEHSLILKDDIINLCNIRKNNYKKKTQKLLPT